MKKPFFILLIFFSKICFSYCQPAMSKYDFIATMNGKMTKEMVCQDKKITIKSRLLVDLWVYQVTYDETAMAKKSSIFGVISDYYTVEDSRKSKAISFHVEKNAVDLQSVPYVLSYQLAKGFRLSKQIKVFSEEGGNVYQFQVLSKNEKIKTALGVLDTIKIQGKCSNGDQLTYWFWKDNYSMVKEDISRNNSSVLEATIVSQSAEKGCCWD